MTAGELITFLQKVDPDLPVITEGCDCDGSVGSVYIYTLKRKEKDERSVYLCRDQNPRIPARCGSCGTPLENYDSYIKIG